MTPNECLLCGASECTPLLTFAEPDAYERAVGVTAEGYLREWVSCNACGFRYSRYSRDADILDRLYDDAYRDSGVSWRVQSAEETFRRVVALPADQSETVTRCMGVKAALARLAEDGIHTRARHRPARLLDVGGATGVFAWLFRDADWQAEIVDPGRQGRFVEAHGIAYHQRRFDRDFQGGPYELVSMVYMLEHVRDPREVLAAAKGILAADGLLYVEVPDEIAFEKKPAEDDIFNSCHLWMFGPASLTRLLGSCGFDPLELSRLKTLRGHYALTVLARPQ